MSALEKLWRRSAHCPLVSQHTAHPLRSVLTIVIKFFQMLAFVLSSVSRAGRSTQSPLPPMPSTQLQHAGFSWRSTIIPIQFIAELTTAPAYVYWVPWATVRQARLDRPKQWDGTTLFQP